ncbi:MAG TPA: DNA primase [Thermoanaerobaculia bacterium]|nr:DNA primase [Thermoanaerobaculia bacterium]
MALSNLQLTPGFVQAVRDAIDVVEVASDYTKLQRAGRKWKGLCPLHKEKTPSFHVDAEHGFFKCFGCGEGGDAIKLHMLLSGDDFPAAMESLARRFGVALPPPPASRGARPRAERERDPEKVLEAAAEWFREQLARSDPARRYLERRRIPDELVERFGLGYAPEGWRNLLGALGSRFPAGELLAVGLAGRKDGEGEPYDRFRNRLIFPIRNASGRLVGFGGRTLGDDVAKYVNTAETDRFHKGSLLYGLDLAKRSAREHRRLLLVEGYLDVLGAVAAGIDWAVASMGTALTPEQARLAARFADEVVIGYDGDEAGVTAGRRALPVLAAQGLAVRRARLPEGEDPDSVRTGRGPEALRALVDEAEDLVQLEIERLVPADVHRNPHGRSRAAKALIELLSPLPDPILRYGYGRIAAERLGVPAQLVIQRLGIGREALSKAVAGPRPQGSEAPPTPGLRAEQEALRELLLAADRGDELPGPDEMPPPEAFLDPLFREFFAAFRTLTDSGRTVRLAEVVAAVRDLPGADEKTAQLLLESEDSPGAASLVDALRALRRRWLRHRLRELQSEISDAQRRDDAPRLEALLAEKSAVNAELHGIAPEAAP